MNWGRIFSAVVVCLVVALVIAMLVDVTRSSRIDNNHKRFCLDEGFVEWKRIHPGDDEFWCVGRGRSINAKELGYKKEDK